MNERRVLCVLAVWCRGGLEGCLAHVSFRSMLMAAIGSPLVAAGCGRSSDKANEETDLTDTVVPENPGGPVDTGGGTDVGCAGSTPILDVAGAASGYVECPDGAILRVDSHVWTESGACARDADCGAGEVCIGTDIGAVVGGVTQCIEADCETGADCDTGECGLSVHDDGCDTTIRLVCRTDDDECRSDVDCPPEANQCAVPYWSDSTWVCAGIECAIGRPLVSNQQAGRAVAASVSFDRRPSDPIAGLDAQTRSVLAAWWARVAQMEHASVASFARFTLELMSLGAPAALLAEVQVAAADEVRHATAAFSLASRFAGAQLTPGALPIEQAGLRQGARAILEGLIEEACVGETVGVIEARAALASCTDLASRAALEAIVRDESRHAALAWRVLAWMLEREPTLLPVAEAAFARATAALVTCPTPVLPHVPAWGLIGSSERTRLREDALREVVWPCVKQVLAGRASDRSMQAR